MASKSNSTTQTNSDALGREQLERVSRIFKAMSETTRLLILRELKDGPCSVGQLVDKLDTSQANVSKQLKTLFDADLLQRKKSGNQVIYSISEVIVLEMCRLVCDKLNRDASTSENILYEI
ncbi:MAG: ArsR/SmtB family transcription factor [Akkermansiaceae bacterium]